MDARYVLTVLSLVLILVVILVMIAACEPGPIVKEGEPVTKDGEQLGSDFKVVDFRHKGTYCIFVYWTHAGDRSAAGMAGLSCDWGR